MISYPCIKSARQRPACWICLETQLSLRARCLRIRYADTRCNGCYCVVSVLSSDLRRTSQLSSQRVRTLVMHYKLRGCLVLRPLNSAPYHQASSRLSRLQLRLA